MKVLACSILFLLIASLNAQSMAFFLPNTEPRYYGRIACYKHFNEEIVAIGVISVVGHYEGSIFIPKGYKGQDISALQEFKDLCNSHFSVCEGGCWAGGHTR